VQDFDELPAAVAEPSLPKVGHSSGGPDRIAGQLAAEILSIELMEEHLSFLPSIAIPSAPAS
jgi:hypothetical protein